MKFAELFRHFKEMKHYFIAASLVFGFGFVLGWQQPAELAQYLHNEMKGIQNLSQFINNKENPQLWFFFVIFLNNAVKAVLFVFLGLLLGILPLAMLVVNGMLLGYVLSVQTSEHTLLLIAKGILPHGVIEIPAIIIACAYGTRLGALVCKMLLHSFVPALGKTARLELKRIMRLVFPLSAILVISLFTAAIVESTITYWLMAK